MEKTESVDSVVGDSSKPAMLDRTNSANQAAALPARIVVQNPAGDVTLGEDITRLKHEVADAQKKHEAHSLESMQPGGQRWAQVAYHQYWLSLCVTLQARKRLMLSPIGVDMGAMLWPVLSIILRQYGIHLGYEETLPVWALLSLSATCFLLDIATLLACSQDSQIVLVLVTIAHVPLYISMFAANLNKNLWVLTRLMVFLCALRVLAVLREITWLETQYHDGIEVKDGWFSRLIVWSLGSTAQRNRQQLLSASSEQDNSDVDTEHDVEQDMVSVYIGPHFMERTANASSVIASPRPMSPEGSSSLVPVSESAAPDRMGSLGFQDHTLSGRCTHDSGVELGRCDAAPSSSSFAQDRHHDGAGVCGMEGSLRMRGFHSKVHPCPENSQAMAEDRGRDASKGQVPRQQVTPGRGFDYQTATDHSCLTREESTDSSMCTAESSM